MTELKSSRIAPDLTISSQLQEKDFPVPAARGVKMVINDRPEGEEAGQLTAAQGYEFAHANGMDYRHVPVVLPTSSEADIRAFACSMMAATEPVHAHCRSGLRSATLWALNKVAAGRLTPDQAQRAISKAGLDPKVAMVWRAGHGAGSAA